MEDLLSIAFTGLKFDVEKNYDGKDTFWRNLECVENVSLSLLTGCDGNCQLMVIDEKWGQPFPDTKDVCYEVLNILWGMRNKGVVK